MIIINDDKGREWNIAVTIGSMANIKDNLGIDLIRVEQLLGDGEDSFFASLTDDEIYLAKIISFCCDPNSYAQNDCSRQEFIESLTGKVFFEAREAFVKELIRFFEEMGRPYRAKIIRTWDEFVKKAVEQLNENFDSTISKIDLDKIVKETKEAIQAENSGI